ncbi:MAG: RIP metalloprotease RseP [Acidobacteriaceae bacterium]|nr:RIP metalloprotease RseP [Acidobacteriaceae bacterium]
MSVLYSILVFGIVLGVMVIVHEFGHFAAAKLCGIRVEVFSIGFGKRLFGFRKGDTDYRVALIPLGGYVKMAGENPGEETTGDPGEFTSHPRWQRMIVAIAGPVANFILALVLMAGLYMVHHEVDEYLTSAATADYISPGSIAARTGIQPGDTIVRFADIENPTWEQVLNHTVVNLNQTVRFDYMHGGERVQSAIDLTTKDTPETVRPDTLMGVVPLMQANGVVVSATQPDTPAAHAGLQPKDQIVAIDHLQIHSVPALLAYMQDQSGKPAELTIRRDGQSIRIAITPTLMDGGDGRKTYRLGFEFVPPPVKVDRLSFTEAAKASWAFNKEKTLLIRDVIRGMMDRHISVRSLSGPIGIWQVIYQMFSLHSWPLIIGLMAYISLNLGIFNLLPFPILDGGMILFLLIESVIRRDVNQQFKERVYQVAFVCIMVFAAFVIFNDISKLGLFPKLKP